MDLLLLKGKLLFHKEILLWHYPERVHRRGLHFSFTRVPLPLLYLLISEN